MKKNVILSIILIAAFSTFSFTGNLINLNLDVSGELDAGSAGTSDVDSGYSLLAEFPMPFKAGGFNLGIGTEYQLDRDVDSGGKLRFWNKYLIFSKKLVDNSFHTIQPVVKLGMGNATSADGMPDLDDGMYYSLGVRYRLSSLAHAEISYSVNQAEIKGTNTDVDYTRINFTWGTRFDGLYKAKKQVDAYNVY
ncbi:MAG: hypothetical protein ACOCWO_01320 [Candidatus Muiribacteriaceae bacterium]